MCEQCGVHPKLFHGYSIAGTKTYKRLCSYCHKSKYHFPWKKHKEKQCEMCGYEPLFLRSLDVHHRDGDKKNNDPSNLMTLCATCHRELEGAIHDLTGDWKKAEGWLKRIFK